MIASAAGVLPPPSGAVRDALSEREFRLFQDLVRREAGICLGPHKKALLVSRLGGRLRELGLTRFEDYFQRIAAEPGERERMIERLCTHETRFFREPRQFEFLERQLLPDWVAEAAAGRRSRSVRAWSAGCSTGEEPYSLAMMLATALPAGSGWDCQVLGTDLSARALEAARSATWPIRRAGEIPPDLLKRFMRKGIRAQEGWMRADPELRKLVHLQQLNLVDPVYPVGSPFDLIFCRNVLIYFDAETRDRVVERLLGHLAPGGHLFLGHAESLLGRNPRVRGSIPSVYTLAR